MRVRNIVILVVLLASLGLASAPARAADTDTQGYIYGTIETTRGNEYTGMMRWGTEEAFWDDLFNSSKVELPYIEEHGKKRKKERSRIKIFGFTIGYKYNDFVSSRIFISRFGDIQEIRPGRGNKADVVMKNGNEYRIDGGSNDLGAKITVLDDSLGEVQVDWERIERIRFRATPAGVEPIAARLFGTVETRDGDFEGYVQWDLQECMGHDKLDGESEDGELSIAMGKIRSIERRNRNGSYVDLIDGRRMVLEDSNDVDSSLRGIFVEDARFGRVEIPWEAFRKVTFREGGSGRGYDDYRPARELRGVVTDYEGTTYRGVLIFDLDESETFEMLNGYRDEIEYYIPFERIRSIVPSRGDSSVVTLKNDLELELGDGQDVAERNDGVVVLREPEGRQVYLEWRDVKKVVFE